MFSREVMLREHLMHNFVPPCPDAYECAIEAIDACNQDESERMIDTPGGNKLAAFEIVDQLRLDFFIGDDHDGN